MIWGPVTLLTPPVDTDRLSEFVRKVRPGSTGWSWIYQREGLDSEPYLARALSRWIIAVIILFGLNFLIGETLLGWR